MNRSFKSVFNRRTGVWQVASEKMRGATKSSSAVNLIIPTILMGMAGILPMTASAQTIVVQPGETKTVPLDFGAGAYSGGGISSSGTLLINTQGFLNNTLGTLTNSGMLANYGTLNNSNTGTLYNFGMLANYGTLTNDGTLNNNHILSNDGTLNNNMSLRNDGMMSNDGTLNNNGTLKNDFVLNNNGTLNNDGTLTNSDTLNNYGTLNNSGTLIGDVMLQGASSLIVFQGTVARTYADVLSGDGKLEKEGSGTQTLSGANTYTGTTTVNGGTLNVTGSTVSATTIHTSATLTGTGAVGATTALDGATVHVANNDTLTINGNYMQQAGGVLRVDANATNNYGKLLVTGNASFAAQSAINVNVNDSTVTLTTGNTLTNVVTVNGVLTSNGFEVTDNSALFNFRAIENAHSVDLEVLANSTSGIRDAVREQGFGFALGAAGVMDTNLNNGATGDMGTVINQLGQFSNNRDIARATAQTLPLISGNQAIQGTLSTFQKLIQNRNGVTGATGLSSGDALLNKNGWARVFGSRAEQDDRSGAAGFKADTWGLALGADAEVSPGARFGVAYGYAKTSVNGNADLSGSAQRANIDSHVVSAYGSKDLGGNRTFSFQGDIGMSDNKSTRRIDFMNRSARADYRTYSAHVGAAIAQAFELSEKTTLTPALRSDYTWLKSQGYNESGADALNLNVGSNTTDAFVIGADAYLQHRFSTTSRLDANVGIGYDAINKQGNIVAAYAGASGQSFVTTGIDHSPWLLRGGVGYSILAANGTEVSFRYDAEGRSDYLNHTASVRAKWAF